MKKVRLALKTIERDASQMQVMKGRIRHFNICFSFFHSVSFLLCFRAMRIGIYSAHRSSLWHSVLFLYFIAPDDKEVYGW